MSMPAANSTATANHWRASLDLRFSYREPKTRLSTMRFVGPLRVQRPFYPEGDVCHVYLLHPPGGVVATDRLAISVDCEADSHALVTTPGSGKFYLSAGDTAGFKQTIRVQDDACLEWLPQENIFFPGAKAKVETEIHLSPKAKFIGWEITCLGRPSNGLKFCQGANAEQGEINGDLHSRLKVYLKQELVLLECLKIKSQLEHQASTGMRDFDLQASALAYPADQALLEQVQALLAEQPLVEQQQVLAGATLLDQMLVVRVLADFSRQAHQVLLPVWQLLRPAILQKPALEPRIWST